jgi:hypothetical protein
VTDTRRHRRLTVVFALVVATTVFVSALTRILDFPWTNPSQELSQWCWAGSSQAILSYYGTTVSQCTIANYAWGYHPPAPPGYPTDCCDRSATGYWSYTAYDSNTSYCNNWNYMWGISSWGVPNGGLEGILAHWGVASTHETYSTTTPGMPIATVLTELDAGRPIVMRFGWKPLTSGLGHFLDIYGYADDGTYLDYWDPRPGWGSTRSLYSWVVDAPDHQWTHSLRLTTNPPSHAPVFSDDPLVRRVTVARAVHITELRQAIDELRTRYGLSAFAWTDGAVTAATTQISATHLVELRAALADVFVATGRPVPTYTDETITPGVTVVTAAQIVEIRAAIKGIW